MRDEIFAAAAAGVVALAYLVAGAGDHHDEMRQAAEAYEACLPADGNVSILARDGESLVCRQVPESVVRTMLSGKIDR